MAEVNLTLGDPIEVKVTPAEGATNVSVASAPQNVVQVQAAIATNGLQGADGIGVPAGGDEGQALVKTNDTDYQTQWAFIDKLHINVINNTGATIPAGVLCTHLDFTLTAWRSTWLMRATQARCLLLASLTKTWRMVIQEMSSAQAS